ncbi:MAG: ATP-dependent sacrificial sulfur transferase LarE [Candidatus Hydrogenedentes bacterium]|nr:ATP-dependent sacrificial sulfur transferase LarE [Candidatus Hydrogenedentota bacterium]
MTQENVETAVALDEALAETKEARLRKVLAAYPSLAVAYSGGVDSAYLSDVAHEVLGGKCEMILADSPSLPRSELAEATQLGKERGWKVIVIHTDEFQNEDYLKNDGRRCYFCRSELFRKMKDYAALNKVEVLAYGAMADDAFDPTRLGVLAAAEHEIVAPLQAAELGKEEIRYLSRRRDLPTADKAAFACLSSRFPKGTRVTLEDIEKVEAAEETLKGLGFHQYRARHHGDICRIEIDLSDLDKFLDAEIRERVVRDITAAGYKHVTLDLAGYQTPSMAMVEPVKRQDSL